MLTIKQLEDSGFFSLEKINQIQAVCKRFGVDIYVMSSMSDGEDNIAIMVDTKTVDDFRMLSSLQDTLTHIFKNSLKFCCFQKNGLLEAIACDSAMSDIYRHSMDRAINLSALSEYRERNKDNKDIETLDDLLEAFKQSNDCQPPQKSGIPEPVAFLSKTERRTTSTDRCDGSIMATEVLNSAHMIDFLKGASEEQTLIFLNTLAHGVKRTRESLTGCDTQKNPPSRSTLGY